MNTKQTNKAQQLSKDIDDSNKKYRKILDDLDKKIFAADLFYAKTMLKKDINNAKVVQGILKEEK